MSYASLAPQQRRLGLPAWQQSQSQSQSGSSLRQPLLSQSRTADGALGHGQRQNYPDASPVSNRNSAASTPGYRRSSGKLPRAKSDFTGFGMKDASAAGGDHIRVVVRVRPRAQHEEPAILEVQQDHCTVRFLEKGKLLSLSFDRVFGEAATQQQVFEASAVPLVENVLEGFNCSLCAYGQTGAGKTYTSFGPLEAKGVRGCAEARGLVQRSLEQLFIAREEASRNEAAGSHRWSMQCSFLEIYREQISDLLDARGTNLALREDAQRGVYVEDLAQVEVLTLENAFQVVRRGLQQRRVASTRMNDRSSRSHAIFTVVVQRQTDAGTRSSSFSFVDLAGAERQGTGSSTELGEEMLRVKEAGAINKSLSALTDVVLSLSEGPRGSKHIRYRDSKLTFLLRDSLGGNAKTAIVANVAPSQVCQAETASTLRFASRAKSINCQAVRSEELPTSHDGLVREVLSLRRRLWELTTSRTETLAQGLAAAFNTPPSWGRSRSASSSQAERVEEDDGQGSSTGSLLGKLFQHAKNALQPEEEPGASVTKQSSSQSAAEASVSPATSVPHLVMAVSSTAETGIFSRRPSEEHSDQSKAKHEQGSTSGLAESQQDCDSDSDNNISSIDHNNNSNNNNNNNSSNYGSKSAADQAGKTGQALTTAGAAPEVSGETTKRSEEELTATSSSSVRPTSTKAAATETTATATTATAASMADQQLEPAIAAPDTHFLVAVEPQDGCPLEQQHRNWLEGAGPVEEETPRLPLCPPSGSHWIAIGEGQSPREIPTSEALLATPRAQPCRRRWLLASCATAGLLALLAATHPPSAWWSPTGTAPVLPSSSAAEATSPQPPPAASHALRGSSSHPPPSTPTSTPTKRQQEHHERTVSAEASSKRRSSDAPSSHSTTNKINTKTNAKTNNKAKTKSNSNSDVVAKDEKPSGRRPASGSEQKGSPSRSQHRPEHEKQHGDVDQKSPQPREEEEASPKEDAKSQQKEKAGLPYTKATREQATTTVKPTTRPHTQQEKKDQQQLSNHQQERKHGEEKTEQKSQDKKDAASSEKGTIGTSVAGGFSHSSHHHLQQSTSKPASGQTTPSQVKPESSADGQGSAHHAAPSTSLQDSKRNGVGHSTSHTDSQHNTNTNANADTNRNSKQMGASHGSSSAHPSVHPKPTGHEHTSAPSQSLSPQGVGAGAGISSGTSASTSSGNSNSNSNSKVGPSDLSDSGRTSHGHGSQSQAPAHPAEHRQVGPHHGSDGGNSNSHGKIGPSEISDSGRTSHGSSSPHQKWPATQSQSRAPQTQQKSQQSARIHHTSASHPPLPAKKKDIAVATTAAPATTKAVTTTAAPTPAFVCKHHRCDGGGCDQRGCSRPLCDGGHCNQAGTFEPDCAAGHCNQQGAVGAVCGGGGCSH